MPDFRLFISPRNRLCGFVSMRRRRGYRQSPFGSWTPRSHVGLAERTMDLVPEIAMRGLTGVHRLNASLIIFAIIAAIGVGWGVKRIVARRPAPTPLLDRAARLVNAEATFWGNSPDVAREYILALSAMDYVLSHVRAINFSALKRTGTLPNKITAEIALELEAGICCHHVTVFLEIMKRADVGVPVRAVEFWLHDEPRDQNRSHVVAEVFYRNKWRLFDVTAGTYFLESVTSSRDELLSAEEVRSLARRGEKWRELAVTNETGHWYQATTAFNCDPFDYLAWHDSDVLFGVAGTISLRPNRERTEFSFDSVPNTVGWVSDYCGGGGRVAFRLDPKTLADDGRNTLEITVASRQRRGDAALFVRDDLTVLRSVPLAEIRPGDRIDVDLSSASGEVFLDVDPHASGAHLCIGRLTVTRK